MATKLPSLIVKVHKAIASFPRHLRLTNRAIVRAPPVHAAGCMDDKSSFLWMDGESISHA
jgi:hypothetical protein